MLGVAEFEAPDPERARRGLEDLELAIAARSPDPEPIVLRVEADVEAALREHDEFHGQVAEDVMLVLGSVIRYVAARLAGPAHFMKESEELPVEKELADDFELWLRSGILNRGTLTIEHRAMGGGRADVAVGFGTHQVVVELKRELDDASREHLETVYSDQAASYQATDYPFGAVLVLDLSLVQTTSTPRLPELIFTSEQAVASDRRLLMFAIVPGRRQSPSELTQLAKRGR